MSFYILMTNVYNTMNIDKLIYTVTYIMGCNINEVKSKEIYGQYKKLHHHLHAAK